MIKILVFQDYLGKSDQDKNTAQTIFVFYTMISFSTISEFLAKHKILLFSIGFTTIFYVH